MSAVIDRLELRSIGDLPAPCTPTIKFLSSGRLPKHGCSPMDDWANEVPLPAAKVAGTRDQIDPLIDSGCLNANPTRCGIAKVGRDQYECENFSATGPLDHVRLGGAPRPYRSLSNETIEVQLQSVLQANPLTFAWHCQSFRPVPWRAPGKPQVASRSESVSKSFGAVGGASERLSGMFKRRCAIDTAASLARVRFTMSVRPPSERRTRHISG